MWIRRAEQEAVLAMLRVVGDRWGLSHLCWVGRPVRRSQTGGGGAYDSVATMEDAFDLCSAFPRLDDRASARECVTRSLAMLGSVSTYSLTAWQTELARLRMAF